MILQKRQISLSFKKAIELRKKDELLRPVESEESKLVEWPTKCEKDDSSMLAEVGGISDELAEIFGQCFNLL